MSKPEIEQGRGQAEPTRPPESQNEATDTDDAGPGKIRVSAEGITLTCPACGCERPPSDYQPAVSGAPGELQCPRCRQPLEMRLVDKGPIPERTSDAAFEDLRQALRMSDVRGVHYVAAKFGQFALQTEYSCCRLAVPFINAEFAQVLGIPDEFRKLMVIALTAPAKMAECHRCPRCGSIVRGFADDDAGKYFLYCEGEKRVLLDL